MAINLLKILIRVAVKFMTIPITIDGYTFSMWEILIFGVVTSAFAIIAGTILRGGTED